MQLYRLENQNLLLDAIHEFLELRMVLECNNFTDLKMMSMRV
jgi:phosphatidylinositol-3,4,5-trisphosphate 3-phosphatase and dual-specificity protein phosphatase PTEN